MRTVFGNSEIPHLWAHQTQDNARNGRNSLSFDGRRIYSYAELEGVIVDVSHARELGESSGHVQRVALLNANYRRSMTTSQHMSGIRRACQHMSTFTVPNLPGRYSDDIDHAANLKWYRDSILEDAKAVGRARSNKEWKLNAVLALVETANNYSQTFNLGVTFGNPFNAADMAKYSAEIAEEQERNRVEEEKRAKEREKRLKKARAEYLADLTAWKGGASIRLWRNSAIDEFDYMRAEGEEIVTTQGARVPAEHVKRALRIVLRLIERGETYQRNGHTIPVGHYTVDSVDEQGTVRAGCHTFNRVEVVRIAHVLGVL